MPVPVVCPECAKKLKAPDKARGKALKCPSCGGRVPVPAEEGAVAAPAAQRKKTRRREPVAAGPPQSGEFIAGLDLSRVEDRETEVCPRCGTVIEHPEEGAELSECPKCGADLLTGGKGATAKRKQKFKSRGEDPRVYYSTAPGDAWAFLKKNADVVVRLGILTLVSSLVACVCWVIVRYCAFTPPKLFWGLPAVVGTLFIPGCLWVLQEAVTSLTFENKQKFKRFRFDMLDCVSKAPRIAVWAAVVVWPMTVLDLIAFAGWMVMDTGPMIFLGALGLHALAAFLFWPAGLGHMAMPVSGPGWNFFTVASGTAKNPGPVLFWAALTFAAFLPFLGLLGGAAALAGPGVVEALDTMEANNVVYRAAAAEAAEAKRDDVKVDEAKLTTVNWNAFLIPGVALIPLSFLFGFGAVYASRPAGLLAKMFRPSLGLITLARERKYVPKMKRKDELGDLMDEEKEEFGPKQILAVLGVCALLGVVGGFAYSMMNDNTNAVASIGSGLFVAGLIPGLISGFMLLAAAFKESTMWGLIYLFLGPPGQLAFVVMNWSRAKNGFFLAVGANVIIFVGVVLMIVGGGGLIAPSA
ncbi:hypothetical protein [Alienimonas californiensis]|uniref:Double zinc ribbon n=1 Tax=Alienimonas californiensis TaxID=2527989 RepID=A0A517PEE1_9PLAN|nr:hypothetical protein [Alienimonas californiensis]QDT17743.1 hypothetical protein CA12_38750 [Alienimonas californiensis]